MLLDGLFNVAAYKGLHHNSADTETDDHLQVAQFGRAGKHNDRQVRTRAANVRKQWHRVAARMQRKQQKVRLVVLLQAVQQGLLLGEEAERITITQRKTKIVKDSQIRFEDKNLRATFRALQSRHRIGQRSGHTTPLRLPV